MDYYNTVRLLKGESTLTPREYRKFKKGDTIWGANECPEEIMRWPVEEEETAKAELAKYRCEYSRGIEDYYITEYALEWFDAGEDGELEAGSDYDLAKEAPTPEED